MTLDPFDGYLLLSYELKDDPGQEHEEWVEDLAAARRYLRGKTDMVAWACLTDTDATVIADTDVLI